MWENQKRSASNVSRCSGWNSVGHTHRVIMATRSHGGRTCRHSMGRLSASMFSRRRSHDLRSSRTVSSVLSRRRRGLIGCSRGRSGVCWRSSSRPCNRRTNASVRRLGSSIQTALLGRGADLVSVILPDLVRQSTVKATVEELLPRGILAVAVLGGVLDGIT